MKKTLFKIFIAGVVLVVLAVGAVIFYLDHIVKSGLEAAGPQVARVNIRLDKASLSPLSGNLQLHGLVIGNPEGYKTESAIKAGEVRVKVHPASLLSDKVVVNSVRVAAPEITLEGASLSRNNLTTILDNINATLGGGSTPSATPPAESRETRLQIDDLEITGGKIHLVLNALGGKPMTVPLPAIHLKQLGTSAEGVTGAEVAKRILNEVLSTSVQAAGKVIGDLGRQVVEEAGAATKAVKEEAQKALKGIGDLFKK